jgi:hypothetical protein
VRLPIPPPGQGNEGAEIYAGPRELSIESAQKQVQHRWPGNPKLGRQQLASRGGRGFFWRGGLVGRRERTLGWRARATSFAVFVGA